MALRWTAEGSDLRNDLMIFMQSFATERVDRGGDRMEPLGIRMGRRFGSGTGAP
jgi:hypothetical protein